MRRTITGRHSFAGRGALSNPPGRFEHQAVEGIEDGWYAEEVPEAIPTSLEPDAAREVITSNDSPDIPFEQSINPYRGCEHACVYCSEPDTPVLMADGSIRAIGKLCVGDAIYGTERRGGYRRYVRTRVRARWSVLKPAYRVTLEDGTALTVGCDHRFLTERGWKFITAAPPGRSRRAFLTLDSQLMGTGAFARPTSRDPDYREGYLCALIRSDGMLREWTDPAAYPGPAERAPLRLRGGTEAVQRAGEWLGDRHLDMAEFALASGSMHSAHCTVPAVRTSSKDKVRAATALIAWPSSPTPSWQAGYLGGIFDAAGRYSRGVLRICHADPEIIGRMLEALRGFDFSPVVESPRRHGDDPLQYVRVCGGLREHLRFFHLADPAIGRKRDISGQAVESLAQLRVIGLEPLGRAMRLIDITTGTGDYLSNGVVSHNCYARPSHAYLGLSPGLDFETRLFYKADAAALLEKQLARPGYVCKSITLGANTDPYQPVEARMKVTRSILEVLTRARHPVNIITKGALVLRDLDLLKELARDGLTSVSVSITSLDVALKRRLEPRTAGPLARVRVIRELSAAGVPCAVMFAPVIPALNDHEMESVLEASAAAGARWAGYVLVRLPYEIKDLFREWLEAHYPQRAAHVMALIQDMRGGRDNDPRFGTRMRGTGPYAELLRSRFQIASRRLGLNTTARNAQNTALFRAPTPRGAQLSLGL